jgi:hypothetical protein
MLLGDFNMHHPAWGGIHVTGETQAERLLHEIEAKGLKLATPRGEPTWKRGQCESVIDLTFLSDGLYKRLSFCGTEDRWALTKDHIPIRIQIDAAVYPTAEKRRFAIGKLDQATFLQKVQRLEWATTPDPLETLQKGIQEALKDHCPRARPSQQARHEWTPRAAELLAGARQARRRYHAHG